ncbi:MAG: hypothetical protein OXH38_11535 [Chloroflexi bacterium]|nr:hypothetical protein [Chloroflexota bacterium]
MRVLLATALLVMSCLVACSDDAIPTAAPPSIGQAEPPVEKREAPEAEAEPEQSSQPAPQPASSPVLIFRLTDDLHIYPWPGERWQPFVRHRPNTLLLADGRTRSEDGDLWLRLDMNGNVVGWVRQDETPLDAEEIRSLPWVPAGELPTAQIAAPGGDSVTVTVLGKAADGAGLVVQFAGSEAALWIDRWLIDDNYRFDWLPIYTGTVAGRWEPWRGDQTGDLSVQVYSYGADVAPWPGGPPLAWRLRSDRYPVLGRSFDGQWLALRVETLDPPVAWFRFGARELDFDPADLPIFLSLGIELVTLDADGRAVASMFFPEQLSHWEWRGERELLLSERDSGTWLWNVERNESRKVSERRLANVSPDGAFAVDVFHPDPSVDEWWRDPRHTAVVSLNDGSEVIFEAVHKPWGSHGVGFQQFWSADSQWLLSTVSRHGDEMEPTRHFGLSISGELVEIVAPEGESASHWSRLQTIEQAGGTVRYFNVNGDEIDRPWTDAAYPPAWEEAEPPPDLPDGWWRQSWSPDGRWILVARSRLANEFDESGLAALPWTGRRAWGVYEIGLFDREGNLLQVFRGFGGLDCGLLTSTATWSPDGSRILFGPRSSSCA